MGKSVNLFHWIPGIICISAILFISIFAADAFAPGLTIWQQLGGFVIHLIPSFILLGFLLVAWKWEMVGGIILLVVGIIMSPVVFMLNYNRNHFSISASLGIVLVITFPFIITGVLFIISHNKKKEKTSNPSV